MAEDPQATAWSFLNQTPYMWFYHAVGSAVGWTFLSLAVGPGMSDLQSNLPCWSTSVSGPAPALPVGGMNCGSCGARKIPRVFIVQDQELSFPCSSVGSAAE